METSIVDVNVVNKIINAKNRIINNIPPIYYGAFLTFELKETDQVKNVAFDGKTYYYNRDWVFNLSDEEIEVVLLHDILHYICGHPFELKATAQNPKSVQIYMLDCDNHVERLMRKLGYEPFIKPNISNHSYWLKPHEVISGIKNGKPWLDHNIIYQTDSAKYAEITYCYNIGENENSFYKNIMGLKSIIAFFAYNHEGKLIRVTKRNKGVKELIEIYNLEQKLSDTPEENL